ncbi:MAG: type II toxin-antitoxin system mRNA interferase toxin, RelE/StbE family [Ignavibacteria bacterium]|nr:type II toxin-antitoxin system mRNA interferase toxin, RelE/StbE family [Ignavibacteria bacterium]
MVIRVSSQFKKAYRALPSMIKAKAKERESIFRNNPFDPQLETHKLHGKYKEYWAFSVTGHYRIMFRFNDNETVDFMNIGTHDIYK